MLAYARQRAANVLRETHRTVLVTGGPAGIQASEVPCQAVDLILYLLVPLTSDHLFNLEAEPVVTLVASGWELKGNAQILCPNSTLPLDLILYKAPLAEWCALVRVDPQQLHIRRPSGWGYCETIDLR